MMYITDPKVFKTFANPFFWRYKAEEMKKSAELLKDDVNRKLDLLHEKMDDPGFKPTDVGPIVGAAAFAMYGFAIECLLKGIIISRHPEYTSDGRVSKKLKTHDLLKLSEMANFKYDNVEELFFVNISRKMAEFRYPVPSTMEETQYFTATSGDFTEIFEILYTKMFNEIKGFNIYGHDEDRCPNCIAKKQKEESAADKA